MSKRSIMVVGLDLPWPDAESIPLQSARSLLDGDLIVINPTITYHFTARETFQGKPCFDESSSFTIRECMHRWSAEISAAYDAGKTVVVLLTEREDFFLYTGGRTLSGSGRNQKTTNHVEASNNYAMIPYKFVNLRNATGSRFRKSGQLMPIQSYWNSVESFSEYRVIFDRDESIPLLTTHDESKVVAAALQAKGHIVFVPDVNLPDGELEEDDADEDGNPVWTEAAVSFAARLEAAFKEIDRESRAETLAVEAPDWANVDLYRLPAEADLEKKISAISKEIEDLQESQQKLTRELQSYTSVKSLLFAQGKQLESAVRAALVELGFAVTTYQSADSEFDVVFEADGFRYIGEVEGKDEKAINVNKISQLERNVAEDFQRDEIEQPAIGVLFGNSHRLTELTARGDFFTDKVRTSAKRTGSRLVRTTDLFHALKEYREQPSAETAAKFRNAFHQQTGTEVKFPFDAAIANPPLQDKGIAPVKEKKN